MSEEESKTETAAPAAADPPAVAAEEAKEEESTATFAPVVQLQEVDVMSGEEDEEVVFIKRSKLFIFGETLLDKGTGNKTWRERGIGDIRILRHKEHGKLRLLMRQEKTMKVICNHAIDPRIALTPNAGNDRSWVWRAYDFADGEELVETMFAIRFADSDIALKFKEVFEKCQQEMQDVVGSLDEPTTDGEAEKAVQETADTLAGLSTKEDGKEETTPAD